MKNTLLLFISIILLNSCSKDDGPSQIDESAKIIGTYSLSAINISAAQDVNADGAASNNLLDEMVCIAGTLIVNADTSWNLNITRINVASITGGTFFIDCGDADASQGTWTFSNNQLSLNGGLDPTVYLLVEDTLTRQIGEDLPGFQSVAFTKQ